MVPASSASFSAPASSSSAGQILQMVRDGAVFSRSDIARVTGLARSTVSSRVEDLLAMNLLVEDGDRSSTGGRPATHLRFNSKAGVVLAADLGATHCRLAVTDLLGRVIEDETAELAIAQGPDAVLGWAQEEFDVLLQKTGNSSQDVRGIGIGVPGPVEFAAGRVVDPPIMPGWHEVSIPERLAVQFPGVPVFVDNDVNVMAMGEYWINWRNTVSDLLFVKVATGIGAGVIVGGRLHRGARGAAGDIGHVRVDESLEAVCACGNVGCIEAVASGSALARRLSETGTPATGARDVVDAVRSGNATAVRLVREAGRQLGVVLAPAINLLNPAVLVVGGDLAKAAEQFFAGIREVIYSRSTVLATSHLQIVRSRLGDHAGVSGAALIVLEELLRPEVIDAALGKGAA